jgi:hypothetical protein
MKRVSLVVLLLSASLLVSCAPQVNETPVEVQQFSGSVSYYPHEAGATWQYLGDGETMSSPRITAQVLGPTVLNGELWVVTRAAGKGLDTSWYRQYRPDGVFLLKEVRPGMELSYDPPLQEMPPEGSLRVGATWTGDTTVTVFYPEAKNPEEQTQKYSFNYTYTVVDQRDTNPPAGDFNVYVINFVARTTDADGNETPTDTQETWFTPNVGEIRTENGYFLVDTNVRPGVVQP